MLEFGAFSIIPTSVISTCVYPLIITSILVTSESKPETENVTGYGDALDNDGILIPLGVFVAGKHTHSWSGVGDGVGVIVDVIVDVIVFVGVTVFVGVMVGVDVLVGVIVLVIVGVMVGVMVLVGVMVGVIVEVIVGVIVGVTVLV